MKKLIIMSILTSSLIANIGEITALKGEAILIHNGVENSVKVGSTLEEHDELKTALKSKIQIVFKDKTVISLGQKSHFKIDEYLFEDKRVSAKFSVGKGFFKSITGRIGKISPNRFKIKTANATIGVRGTTIIGEVTFQKDIIACSSGQIIVTNTLGSMVVNAGERTVVEKMKMPRQSQKINTILLKQLNSKSDPKVQNTQIQTTPIVNQEKKIEKSIEKDIELAEEKTAKTFEPWSGTKIESLKSIEDVLGTSTPTYSGKIVDGSTNFGAINTMDSNVNLGFDLGSGEMNGELKFNDEKENSYDIKIYGKLNNDKSFKFGSENSFTGGGSGQISGKEFQNANGNFNFQTEDINTKEINNITGSFETSR